MWLRMSSGSNLSREFFDLVKSIGECRSKQEEDQIIERETVLLKSKLGSGSGDVRECMVRAIYVEMLGHDASFAYIHGVNLCHNKSLISKRIGYLVCCLFLNPDSELMILLINTIQKDLRSTNLLEISFALIVVSKLATEEMIPVLMGLVTPLLSHSSDMIRRRAMIAFHRMTQIATPNLEWSDLIRKSLCDSDPGVMAVGLNPILNLALADPDSYRDLLPSLVHILRQIIDHKLPRDFDYHRMPAPWIQVRIVSLLGVLARGDSEASESLVEILRETMRRADVGSNAGTAVVYEVVKAATRIVPNHTLLEHCLLMCFKFFQNGLDGNSKYVGIKCLSMLVGVDTSYAREHQLRVVELLDDSDETLKRQALDLLYRMTNAANVEVVVERMLQHVADQEIGRRIFHLADQFSPSNTWYLQTVNEVYYRRGSINPEVAHNLTRLVAEDDEEELRVFAADEYLHWMEKYLDSRNEFSPIFLQLIVWMIGEFATLSNLPQYSCVDDVLDLLQEAFRVETKCPEYFIAAITKLAVFSSNISGIVSFLAEIGDIDLKDQITESIHILSHERGLFTQILPFDASCEDINLTDFSFLNKFVASDTQTPHTVAQPRQIPQQQQRPVSLKFEAYSAPSVFDPQKIHPSVPVVVKSSSELPQLKVASKKWGVPAGPVPQQPPAPPKEISEKATKQAPVNKFVPPASPSPETLERQKLAAALFSGVHAPVGNNRWKQSPAPIVVKTEGDLLDFGTAIPPRKPSSQSDLLG